MNINLKVQRRKYPGPDVFIKEFLETFKKDLASFLHRSFQKIVENGTLPRSF